MDRIAGNYWLAVLGFAMLTFDSVLPIYGSKEDAWSVAFILSAYFALLLLFWCLALYVCAASNAARRRKLKAAIWSLSTFLIGMFSYKVAALMPWLDALVICGMAAALIIGGFYDFFIHPDL